MGLLKSLKRKLGKSKSKKVESGPTDPLADSLADPLLADGDVTKRKNVSTSSAIGEIQRVQYKRKAVGKGKAKRGFFKSNAGMEDPMLDMSSEYAALRENNLARRREDRDARRAARDRGEALPAQRPGLSMSQDEKHMAARAVMSSRVDQVLGTDVLSEERFATHDGQVGVSSMQVDGESLRVDEAASWKRDGGAQGGATYQNHLDFDVSQGSVQRDLSNLQVNDYLTGQVDRHAGNMFYDDKTGRLRGIDNDLAFGDRFNERFGDPDTGMAKHVNELPKFIDAATAARIVQIDLLDYWEMLQGDAEDPQRLTMAEATDGMERMARLQTHVERLMAKARGEDVDVDGQIVGEWNDDTFDAQKNDEGDSYLKRVSGALDGARAEQDEFTVGVSKPGEKRDMRSVKGKRAKELGIRFLH